MPGHWANSDRAQQLPSNWRRGIVPRILARDDHTCYLCGAYATQVDHVNRGDNHDDSNLAAICTPCHDVKSAREGVQARQRNLAKRKRTPEQHPGLIETLNINGGG